MFTLSSWDALSYFLKTLSKTFWTLSWTSDALYFLAAEMNGLEIFCWCKKNECLDIRMNVLISEWYLYFMKLVICILYAKYVKHTNTSLKDLFPCEKRYLFSPFSLCVWYVIGHQQVYQVVWFHSLNMTFTNKDLCTKLSTKYSIMEKILTWLVATSYNVFIRAYMIKWFVICIDWPPNYWWVQRSLKT